NVDIARGKRGKSFRGNAGMAAHAAADYGDLRDIGGAVEPSVTDSALGAGDGIAGADIIRGRDGESEIGGGAVLGDVLHDHGDVDIGVRKRTEDRRGDGRVVVDVAMGNRGYVL